MLHPQTKLQWLDIKADRVYDDYIDKLYQSYSHMAVNETKDISLVSFEDSNVMLIDWYGWTSLQSIRRVELKSVIWRLLSAEDNRLILDNNTLIPTFNPDDVSIGFHGERIYGCTIKKVMDLTGDEKIKVRRTKTRIDNPSETIGFTLSDIFTMIPSTHGYQIKSKSKYFNANSIYLFGDTVIPKDLF